MQMATIENKNKEITSIGEVVERPELCALWAGVRNGTAATMVVPQKTRSGITPGSGSAPSRYVLRGTANRALMACLHPHVQSSINFTIAEVCQLPKCAEGGQINRMLSICTQWDIIQP